MATAFAIVPKRYADYFDVPQQFQPRLVQRQVIADPSATTTTTTTTAAATTTTAAEEPSSTTTTTSGA